MQHAAPNATGGKAKKASGKKKASAKKPARKSSSKKPAAKKAAPKAKSLEQVKKEAKRLKIALSKDGKAKTKAQLQAAIAYRKRK